MKISIGDCQLYYEDVGEGEPLVLLHGNNESGDYFQHQIQHFSQSYRVIAVDTRGHGRSERGTAPFTLKQFARDLERFLTALNLEKVHLLGFSDGGNIAMLFALRCPKRLRSLIVNGANLQPLGMKFTVWLSVALAYLIRCAQAPCSREAAERREMLGLMVREPHIPKRALGKLHMPVLVIVGSRDMIRDSHTRAIADAIQGSCLVILEGTHFIAAEASAEFNQTVGEFLREAEEGENEKN